MAPHHDDRERQGSHPLTEWAEPRERSHGEETMERLEMDRATAGTSAIPFSWSGMRELVYAATGLLGLASVYYGVVGEVRDSRKDIEALAARVVLIERGRAENIPRLEEQIRLNGLQDQRIQNVTEANGRTATAVNDLGRQVDGQGKDIADMRVRQAVLEERMGHATPHDR